MPPPRPLLQLDRADPLAAGLDHVLGAVEHPQVAVGVDRADVAGVAGGGGCAPAGAASGDGARTTTAAVVRTVTAAAVTDMSREFLIEASHPRANIMCASCGVRQGLC
jgi:hypothetical protein